MKNLFKKGAVAAAVAGSLMVSGVTSADSVLAPLVVGINGGSQTFLSIKARGAGTVNARMASTSDLHYVWFKKGTNLASLASLTGKCEVSNNNGKVSPWDMVLQRAVDNDPDVNLDPTDDKSVPNGYSAGDFVGFAVITDSANKNSNPAVKDLANEGELSGFGYVVDAANSFVLDYKLLNNHRSKVEGDFSAGFISKKSVDFSWMPIDIAATEWLTVVTGDDMLKADSGSGEYDATVKFSQDTLAGSVSPQLPFGGSGVYNNDEKVTSGAKNFNVTCMAVFGRAQLMNTLQLADTVNGGWKRMSVAPVSGTNQVASGAIVYKSELIDFSANATYDTGLPYAGAGVRPELLSSISMSVFGTGTYTNVLSPNVSDAEAYNVTPSYPLGYVVAFQPETSGHLSSTPEPHPNRPY